MAYTPTTWVNDSQPAISAENLNNIESGISALDTLAGSTDISAIGDGTVTGAISTLNSRIKTYTTIPSASDLQAAKVVFATYVYETGNWGTSAMLPPNKYIQALRSPSGTNFVVDTYFWDKTNGTFTYTCNNSSYAGTLNLIVLIF